VETFLGLSYIIPLFECMQSLSKFVQVWNVFICDFVDVIKACERDIYTNYMLIQLQTMGMSMEFSKYSLQLCITHMIPYIWFRFFFT
jgi:hypothetical protein